MTLRHDATTDPPAAQLATETTTQSLTWLEDSLRRLRQHLNDVIVEVVTLETYVHEAKRPMTWDVSYSGCKPRPEVP